MSDLGELQAAHGRDWLQARWDGAEKIVRALAAESPPTSEGSNGQDWCGLCGADLPFGVTGQWRAGFKCVACSKPVHSKYENDLTPCCGVSAVPDMRDRRGVITDDLARHDASCVWRLAKEWVEQHGE